MILYLMQLGIAHIVWGWCLWGLPRLDLQSGSELAADAGWQLGAQLRLSTTVLTHALLCDLGFLQHGSWAQKGGHPENKGNVKYLKI
jgi:hypothetical protein